MTTQQGDNNAADIKALADSAAALVERIDGLTNGTGDQLVVLAQTAKRNRRMIIALSVSILLDIALTVLMAFGMSYMNDLTKRIDETQRVTTVEVLCPLYQQFVNADTPAQRELAKKNGQDMKARDEASRVIHHSYDVLGCAADQ